VLIAKIVEGVVQEVGDHRAMYPNTSFSEDGPAADFMAAEGLLPVSNALPYDPATQRAEAVAPYVDGGVVRTVAVVDLPQAEIDAREAARKKAKIDAFQAEAGRRLDAFAVARGYGSIVSICTYDTSSVPRYAADALRARTLRDQWWVALNQIVADVQGGTRPEPATFDDIAGELPALTWE
jgi:hypothetical protein